MRILISVFVIVASSFALADTEGFRLIDSDCKTMASILGQKDMKNDTGSKSDNECSIQGKKVTCILKHKDGKIFGAEDYKVMVDSPELMLITSALGNVSYVIDKKQKSFIHAQHSFNETLNGFISKSCVGAYKK